MAESLRNILIIKPSSLGDIVMALPALSALRKSFPDAKISWLVRPEFAALLENHSFLTDIILFDRRFLGKAWYNPRALGQLASLIHRLRRSKFDAVIDLQGLFRTACLGWLSGCRRRFGTTTAREFAPLFYTHKVDQDRNCVHVVDYYLKVVQTAGARDVGVEFVLPQDKAAADSINRLLADHNIRADNYAVFIPSSAHKDKCWPIERFAALGDKIASQFGLPTVATGTASEKGIIDNLENLSNVPIANFAGRTGLRELTALLRAARLVVSNDTGPGQIAAALGVPVVLIFGRSNPIRLAPYGRGHCIAAIDPDGRGLERNSAAPEYNIKAVKLDDVYQKVCEQLGQKIPLTGE